MLKVRKTTRFKKDVKNLEKRHYDLSILFEVIDKLKNGETLERSYYDHPLSGNYVNCRECHIKSDWVLVYYIDKNELILFLFRTGTHSDLFS